MIEEQRAAFCPDGLHPNDAGARRLADRVIAFLGTL
jgi:lysophospholipase L1-like esterase